MLARAHRVVTFAWAAAAAGAGLGFVAGDLLGLRCRSSRSRGSPAPLSASRPSAGCHRPGTAAPSRHREPRADNVTRDPQDAPRATFDVSTTINVPDAPAAMTNATLCMSLSPRPLAGGS